MRPWCFVRDQEVHAVVQDWKARGRPQYVDGITPTVKAKVARAVSMALEELDPLFDQAVQFVTENAKRQFLAYSVSSALVITVQRVLSNRWKRRDCQRTGAQR